jgi:2-keto-3-deoxy-L-rhamnonate aldolase RhmA
MPNRVKEMIRRGEVPAGVLMVSPGGETVQTLAEAGFDYVIVDQMYGSIEWGEAAEMSRAARLCGMTPIMRIPSEPWVVRDNSDQLAINAGRAFSVGFQGVFFAVSSPREIEAVANVALGQGGWHRELQTIPWTRDTFDEYLERYHEETIIGVTIEGQSGLEQVEEIAAVPGLDIITVAMTDLSLHLGHGMNSEHPAVWEEFKRIQEVCKRNGVAVRANTGMGYGTLDEMRMRARKLIDAGVDVILFQTTGLLLQAAGKYVLEEIRSPAPVPVA